MEAMKNWKVELTAGGKTSWGENPKKYLPERCAFNMKICNSDYVTHSLKNAQELQIY